MVYPDRGDVLPSSQQQIVRREVDVTGCYFADHQSARYYGCTDKITKTPSFRIDITNWREEDSSNAYYKRLASEIEEKIGRSNIRIVIY